MKNKKRVGYIISAILLLLVSLIYISRPMTMNDIYDKSNFTGKVIAVFEDSLLVEVDREQGVDLSSDLISVSLDVKLEDSMTKFSVNDRVKVYHDGLILESFPAQIKGVFAILRLEK